MFSTQLKVTCDADFAEILIAEIAEAGFDTFLETESGFEAYVENGNFDQGLLESIKDKYSSVATDFSFHQIPKQNWNEEWEKNVPPIVVDDRCLIRAEFHYIDKAYPYEIIITPKMSFGTGHHQTTWLMIKSQMSIDHTNKRVMDAGCGTAILSIMAEKLGAIDVLAFDIDEWSLINGNENVHNNQCKNITVSLGNIYQVKPEGKFDIIMANINKNVLLNELNLYADYLNPGGYLLLSGFYIGDITDLLEKSSSLKFSEEGRDEKETWASLLLKKY